MAPAALFAGSQSAGDTDAARKLTVLGRAEDDRKRLAKHIATLGAGIEAVLPDGSLFEGLEPVEPGLVQITGWRPDGDAVAAKVRVPLSGVLFSDRGRLAKPNWLCVLKLPASPQSKLAPGIAPKVTSVRPEIGAFCSFASVGLPGAPTRRSAPTLACPGPAWNSSGPMLALSDTGSGVSSLAATSILLLFRANSAAARGRRV